MRQNGAQAVTSRLCNDCTEWATLKKDE